ncbi:DUF948 domain-containing protein [Vagococcus zengguangii]|uniref:DUF948 domain-containing protein n=1 Tax=Vagococcus zengguangii TaxID=2571750 RepID=A0A4D7CU66_9ENTE|nr:DUF948 domain-containing protein [Vagococcus zengguangii]QCI86552.1 DUF948 domain-containing protein [Vagococcus zengguangii]TLG81199.1 DUF948 domain-containing protein [Vagococcus zengguangii]
MTGTEVAALIAAIAFVILVVVLIFFLMTLLPKLKETLDNANTTMKKTQDVVDESNRTLKLVAKDVDVLSHQVEELLIKSNDLLNDVNGKVETIQPLFKAAADLGDSVSSINHSSRNVASKLGVMSGNAVKASVATKVGQSAFKLLRRKK